MINIDGSASISKGVDNKDIIKGEDYVQFIRGIDFHGV